MFNARIKQAGERMKAWYILSQYAKKHKDKERLGLQNWAFQKMNYSPEALLKNVINKMVRSANMSCNKAMMIWKMELYSTREKRLQLNQSRILTQFVQTCSRREIGEKRWVLRMLAVGIALTKA